MSGQRVLVLDGGHRLEDYSWSDEDGPSVDARLASRVEVVRGPTSLLYGADAIGGVILAVRNLANTAYRDFLSRYKAFALNPGRDIMVGVATTL